MAKMTAAGVLGICLFSVIYAASAASKGVPVMIWSNKELKDLPDATIGHTTHSDTFHQEYLSKLTQDKRHNLLVFMQDKLSIDDITHYADVYNEDSNGAAFQNLKELLENSPSSQLPSVLSPSSALSKLQQTYEGRVHSLSAPYSLDDLKLDDSSSNLVLVKLPKTKTTDEGFHDSLKHIDGIIGSVSTELNNRNIPYTAIYTAEKSTKVRQEKKYTGRHLLADDDASQTAADTYTLFNVTNSTGAEWLLFYARNMTIQICETSPTDPENPCGAWEQLPAKDNATATFSGSMVTIEVKYDGVDGFESLTFNMEFTGNEARKFWYFTNFTVTFKPTGGDTETVVLKTSHIEAAYTHSYHCTEERPLYEHNPTKDRKTVNVKLDGFQVQFGALVNWQFGLPNDCVGFFSIGSLSGLTVALLLTLILAFGLSMIMNISTQDRFDDPKGKTITVTAQE